jgi:hypothetical protein
LKNAAIGANEGRNIRSSKFNKRHKDIPWHDIDGKSKLRHIKSLGRLLGNSPCDKSLRLKVMYEKKQYNILVRKKHRIFKSKLLQNLIESSDNNPTEFWKIVNLLKEKKPAGTLSGLFFLRLRYFSRLILTTFKVVR